jgi:hypothetical protein
MTELLKAKKEMMDASQAKMLAKMKVKRKANQENIDANTKQMKEDMKASQPKMDTDREVMLAMTEVSHKRADTNLKEIKEDNNERFKVLQGTLISWKNMHQAKVDALIADMRDG